VDIRQYFELAQAGMRKVRQVQSVINHANCLSPGSQSAICHRAHQTRFTSPKNQRTPLLSQGLPQHPGGIKIDLFQLVSRTSVHGNVFSECFSHSNR